MKRFFSIFIILGFFTAAYSQSSLQQKFIKGNITEKTSTVREASGSDGVILSQKALNFVLENKDILGNDRDLDALAVAAILSYPQDYIRNADYETKTQFKNQTIELFNKFYESSTVRIAVLSKMLNLKDYIETEPYTDLLNNFLYTQASPAIDSSLIKASLNALETIGDNESFIILYNLWNDPDFNIYSKELKTALISLIPISMSEIIEIINIGNLEQLQRIYSLITENSKISTNISCEIAENLLNESILLVSNSSVTTEDLVAVQLGSLRILSENKWTRSYSTALAFFDIAKQEYNSQMLYGDQFRDVINSISSIAPLMAVNKLTNYLEELNSLKENSGEVSISIVTAVINSLGAIGDKSAFDSLLAVTYLNYPESVLSAAREALAGLRW